MTLKWKSQWSCHGFYTVFAFSFSFAQLKRKPQKVLSFAFSCCLQQAIFLHPTPSSSSSSPTNVMSSFSTLRNLFFGLPLGILAGSSNLSILLTDLFTILPLDMSKPSQSGFLEFIFKPSNMRCPFEVFIPDIILPYYLQR